MRRSRAVSLSFALCATLAPIPAFAVQRTFVASTGNDGNPCTLTQPCRTFAAAGGAVAPFGEVIVLDSAGYGPVIVTKALSIIAPPGIYAGVSVPSGNGINVSAGGNDLVVLRGLTINGQGGVDGIQVNSAKEVHIENCTVSNMNQQGVRVNGGGYVRIAGTTLRSNGLSGVFTPPGVTTTLSIDNTRSVHNGQTGFFLNGAGQATIRNSQATDNTSDGARVTPPSGSATVTISGGEYSGNGGVGVFSQAQFQTSVNVGVHGASLSRNFSHGLVFQSVSNPPPGVMKASVSSSHITWNGGDGLATGSFFLTNLNHITVSHSIVSENGSLGVLANGASDSVVSVSANTITRNADFDLQQSNGGVLLTFGNNATTGGSDTSGTLTGKSLK